jgi:CspA family cold shock protein
MPRGIVKWFSKEKGFGFISNEDNRDKVFVHISNVENYGKPYPRKGDKVSFNVEKSPKGLNATHVVKL